MRYCHENNCWDRVQHQFLSTLFRGRNMIVKRRSTYASFMVIGEIGSLVGVGWPVRFQRNSVGGWRYVVPEEKGTPEIFCVMDEREWVAMGYVWQSPARQFVMANGKAEELKNSNLRLQQRIVSDDWQPALRFAIFEALWDFPLTLCKKYLAYVTGAVVGGHVSLYQVLRRLVEAIEPTISEVDLLAVLEKRLDVAAAQDLDDFIEASECRELLDDEMKKTVEDQAGKGKRQATERDNYTHELRCAWQCRRSRAHH